jgi:nicotinate-nucleotide adenylyltransferase
MNRAEHIGVFGGTFDPIHVGHLAAVQDAAFELSLDLVLFVPNRAPPHKQNRQVTGVADRLAMVELSVAGNPLFEVSRIELERPGPSYTLDTMRRLRSEMKPGSELFFLAGYDALRELHTWHQPQRLLDEFRLVMMDRPTRQELDWDEVDGHFPGIRGRITVVHVAQLEISGDDIRRRVKSGKPIRYFVVPAVEQYILSRGLYRATP